jgi:hypothetical protein
VDEPQVGRHDVAGFELDDVAGHEFPRGNFQGRRRGGLGRPARQLLEGGHGFFGAVFLDEPRTPNSRTMARMARPR